MANNIPVYIKESKFEAALTELLQQHGWGEDNVIVQPTEEDLVKNWADIIYQNNRGRAQLGNAPLTRTEMQQILDKVNQCASPYDTNRFINGEQVCIRRDNPTAPDHLGRDVYLKIFDAREIRAGQSRYQIVRQPRFRTSNALAGDRRGDVMLLINGMPVIHIELKRSGVDVSQAVYQIKRYTHEGVFQNGIFSLVQIFVAMTPTETLYFANPGREENFKPEYWFHWEDFNNTVESDYRRVTAGLLSIPMAHQMVGYYTIADDKDHTLKVLRSYQYFAVTRIADRVHNTNWDDHQHRGGYIWHTTGSGKTMTSFKAAQLVAKSGDADKVVFLMDRIELSIQSLDEYRGFAGEDDQVQDTQNTLMLLAKLQSSDNDDRLIVTSIQKMSNIKAGTDISQEVIDTIGRKRLVFIIDECHRSVFGDMLISIRNTFPRALLFGFTGTPVFEENAHHEITTGTLFGDMLHKYTIASAIPDGNVLGFDTVMVNTYSEDDLRERAALAQLHLHDADEINPDNEQQNELYKAFTEEMEMADTYNDRSGEVRHGVEHYLPRDLYEQPIHHNAVVQDIVDNWPRLSRNGKFHAMLATKNIPEAITYYHLFKERASSLNVVAVFDNNIDNSDGGIAKEDALVEMLDDYNRKYQTTFQLATYAKYKKDVAKRLAHKKPYVGIETDHSKQIDLLIVVTQMLTGYDSKWVNTLYVDKLMKYVDVIQSFSRTNRLFGPDKPFGNIRYFTFPYTMKQNIDDALEVYVDRPLGVFVDKLEMNLSNANSKFLHIKDIFESHEIHNFERLPDTREDRNMFAKDFSQLTHLLEAARYQGFLWEKRDYEFEHGETYTHVSRQLDEQTYMTLLQRYRELFDREGHGESEDDDFEYPIDTYITETGTGTIDADYINSRFSRYVKNLYMEGPGSELTKQALRDLHKTFAQLSQKDQRTAIVIIHDIQSGDLHLEADKTIQDYIAQYQLRELNGQMRTLSEATGVNVSQLENIMDSDVNADNINDCNRFENLKQTLDKEKTHTFVNRVKGEPVPVWFVATMADRLLRDFILSADKRNKILRAYLDPDVTLETEAPEEKTTEELFAELEQLEAETTQDNQDEDNEDNVRGKIATLLASSLDGVLGGMRPKREITNSVFWVLEKESLPTLDSVKMYILRAFTNLFGKEKPTIVDKFVSFNLMVTKFEAYLKKLFYLIHGREIQPRHEGEDVTWANVIHAFPCLWQLKFSNDAGKQQLFEWLSMMKGWRNSESHISPTATEKEVDAAVSVCVSMYFFATGSCITDLEMRGYDLEDSQSSPTQPKPQQAVMHRMPASHETYSEEEAPKMAAEDINIADLPQDKKIALLRQAIVSLVGYVPRKSVFNKQRQWESIFRIAADRGFVIDRDYEQFKRFIDSMHLEGLPDGLSVSLLERLNTGIYAESFVDWTADGLTGRKLSEYLDIRRVAEAFNKTITQITGKE